MAYLAGHLREGRLTACILQPRLHLCLRVHGQGERPCILGRTGSPRRQACPLLLLLSFASPCGAAQDFQKVLSTKRPVYEATLRSGRLVREKARLPEDPQLLDGMLQELKEHWEGVSIWAAQRWVLRGGVHCSGLLPPPGPLPSQLRNPLDWSLFLAVPLRAQRWSGEGPTSRLHGSGAPTKRLPLGSPPTGRAAPQIKVKGFQREEVPPQPLPQPLGRSHFRAEANLRFPCPPPRKPWGKG